VLAVFLLALRLGGRPGAASGGRGTLVAMAPTSLQLANFYTVDRLAVGAVASGRWWLLAALCGPDGRLAAGHGRGRCWPGWRGLQGDGRGAGAARAGRRSSWSGGKARRTGGGLALVGLGLHVAGLVVFRLANPVGLCPGPGFWGLCRCRPRCWPDFAEVRAYIRDPVRRRTGNG
jgi:hypothetical protein